MKNGAVWIAAAALLVAMSTVSAEQNPVGSSPPAEPNTNTATARQRIDGNVSSVDRTNGVVRIASAGGNVQLQFPPQTLHGMRSGEPLIVEYGISRGAHPRAYDAAPGPGANQVVGTVSHVDHDTGRVQVAAPRTTLSLLFPAADVRDVRPGDIVTVDLAFTRSQPVPD